MRSLLIQMFGAAALALLLGLAASIALLWKLKGRGKWLGTLPLGIALLLMPALLPTGLWAMLTEQKPQGETFPTHKLRVADGWKVEVIATGYRGLRFIEMTEQGDLLISRPPQGSVMLLRAQKNDFQAPQTLIDGLDAPQGLALYKNWLYIGERSRIIRIKFNAKTRKLVGKAETLISDLPASGGHTRKSIGIGPDRALYVTVGSSCNACIEADERSATIMRFPLDTDGKPRDKGSIYASGLRYSVGFDWDKTGRMFATDNGRDLLGDDYPPCELNEIKQGGFYGWPFYNGFNEADPDFGAHPQKPAAKPIPPEHGFRAHNAPLGMAFLSHTPRAHSKGAGTDRKVALAALHGSWNRSTYDGYKVVSLHWDKHDKVAEEREFLGGFLDGQKRWGRPVDVYQAKNGAIYISEDYRGTLFRVSRKLAGEPSLLNIKPAHMPNIDSDFKKAAKRQSPQRPARQTAAKTADHNAGAALFKRHCLQCHNQHALTLTDLANRHDPASLATMLASPPANMPKAPLDKEQRAQLIAYLLAR